MSKARGEDVVRLAYEEQLLKSYGSLTVPKRHFVQDVADREPFGGVFRELSEICSVDDDTDINCDVCFTFIMHSKQPLIIKLSMVGPYAVILSFGQDGFGKAALVSSEQGAGTVEADIVSVVTAHGFILVPADHLESPVPIALAEGRVGVPLYAALFQPDEDVPWIDGS